jgi:hypothetical protein
MVIPECTYPALDQERGFLLTPRPISIDLGIVDRTYDRIKAITTNRNFTLDEDQSFRIHVKASTSKNLFW